jgi:flagellar motility protein MotE (MotC chaperone)
MSRVRLLPVVIAALTGLLVIKSTELILRPGPLWQAAEPKRPPMTVEDLPTFARALAKLRFYPPTDPEHTGAVTPRKKPEEAKTEAPKDERKTAEAPRQQVPPPPLSASERALLERLQERRATLEDRSRELDMREGLLKAAEKSLDSRADDLRQNAAKAEGGQQHKDEEAGRQIKAVVTMYEAMKPKDAARVFDRLDIRVLLPIVAAMNPRRMSEILAVMSPEAAERLTVALATPALPSPLSAAVAPSGATPPGELPRIDQPPPARPAPAPRR